MLDVMMFSVPSNVLPFVKDPEIAVHADSAMQVFCTVCFVMSISVLFCPVLFCFVLSSSVLYCSVQFCSVQFEFCLVSPRFSVVPIMENVCKNCVGGSIYLQILTVCLFVSIRKSIHSVL